MRKTIFGLCCFMVVLATNVYAEGHMDNEAGTYQLITVNNGQQDLLYKINTKTGQVWVYGPMPVKDFADVDVSPDAQERLKKLIAEAKEKGKTVFTTPMWILTPDKPSDIFTLN